MNQIMTNSEFHEAWSNLSFHHVPDGYWDKIHEQRKKHRFVGKQAFIDGKILECIEAEDDLVIFKITNCSNFIISGNKVLDIKWLK